MTQVKDKHIPRIFNFSYIWCCEMINENNNLMTSKWHDNLKCKYEQLDVFFVSCEHCRKEYKPLTLVILFFFGLHTRMLSLKCVILWLLSLQIFTQMDFLALSVNNCIVKSMPALMTSLQWGLFIAHTCCDQKQLQIIFEDP